MPFVDSHCHLDFPGLRERLPELLAHMREHEVGWALCAGVTLERFPSMRALIAPYDNLFAAVGAHPDEADVQTPSIEALVHLAQDEKVVAIGETGLDYYRRQGDLSWQRERFRTHIRAAREVRKPLIIHCRAASADTLCILEEERAEEVGGVFHCFTESLETAHKALELGFYISFSGIVTFKNAEDLKKVAQAIPQDRLLIETDAPYLAPVPHRGKTNEPAYVRFVAEEIARLRHTTIEELGAVTTENFFTLFNTAKR
ncbi:MAG: TatD family hydrolase [Rhodocyclaceae bacterium]|nr:TatD family hydrolase [Rhodocyclaceae bacterium]